MHLQPANVSLSLRPRAAAVAQAQRVALAHVSLLSQPCVAAVEISSNSRWPTEGIDVCKNPRHKGSETRLVE